MKRVDSDFISGLLLAWRGRCVASLGWLSLLLIVATLLGAQFSGRQPATVALDLGLSITRLGLPLFIVIVVQELFTREFERRYYLYSLTSPRPRYRFLLGRFAALLFLTISALVVCGVLLAGIAGYISYSGYQQGTPISLGWEYITTLAFIAQDLLVISTMAVLIAISATTPSFVLIGTFGFLLVARSYSGIIALLETNRYLVTDPESYQSSLQLLGWFLPDLGGLDIRGISLYGQWELLPEHWGGLLLSSGAYAAALLALSAWVLNRKRFN